MPLRNVVWLDKERIVIESTNVDLAKSWNKKGREGRWKSACASCLAKQTFFFHFVCLRPQKVMPEALFHFITQTSVQIQFTRNITLNLNIETELRKRRTNIWLVYHTDIPNFLELMALLNQPGRKKINGGTCGFRIRPWCLMNLIDFIKTSLTCASIFCFNKKTREKKGVTTYIHFKQQIT